MDRDEEATFQHTFGLGFRELYLNDILRANAGDVQMGTFILCAAFIDALSLAHAAGQDIRGASAEKWKRFMEKYFGAPYQPLWDSYAEYRSRLLHNYSPRGIGFTHAPENAHLHLQTGHDGTVFLHRESFVRDVERAFDAFAADVRSNAEVRGRVFAYLEDRPPLGLVAVIRRDQLG